jgi:hypothetical protein
VVFLATSEQAGDPKELGIGFESIDIIGSTEYPTVAAGAEAAALYLQDRLGVTHVVQLGVFEKVSLFVKQVLANLFGIELNPMNQSSGSRSSKPLPISSDRHKSFLFGSPKISPSIPRVRLLS